MKIKASLIIVDDEIYPRNMIDPTHVGVLAEAIAVGQVLPPIVIDRSDKTVTDGVHRLHAMKKVYGQDVEVEVIQETYKTKRHQFEEAMRLNAGHGRRLTPYDRSRCIIMARKFGLNDAEIAAALSCPITRITTIQETKMASLGKMEIPIKRTISHMAGRKFTQAQARVNQSLPGMSQLGMVNTLIRLIENDMLDLKHDPLMAAIGKLGQLIEGLAVEA